MNREEKLALLRNLEQQKSQLEFRISYEQTSLRNWGPNIPSYNRRLQILQDEQEKLMLLQNRIDSIRALNVVDNSDNSIENRALSMMRLGNGINSFFGKRGRKSKKSKKSKKGRSIVIKC